MAQIVVRENAAGVRRILQSIEKHSVIWAWAAIAIVLVVCRMLGMTLNGDLDDLLKMLKIRSFVDNGAWFDRSVPGILQPEIFYSHWPRLLDLPYALATWSLAPLVGTETALRLAAFAVPLLLLIPAIALFRQIVGRLGFGRPDIVYLLALVPTTRVFFEFAPGRIDYHNIQVVLLLTSICLTMSRRPAAALANGAITALALSTGLEFALFFALAVTVQVVEFIAGTAESNRRLTRFGLAMAATSVFAYAAAEAPANYGAVACDSYSTPHLMALLCAGLAFVLAGLTIRRANAHIVRALAIAVPGVATIALLVVLFPQCLSGPYGSLSPYLRDGWLMSIAQEHSLFTRSDFVLSANMVSASILFVGALAPFVIAMFDRFRDRNLLIFSLFAVLGFVHALLYFRYIRYLPLFGGVGAIFVIAGLFPLLRAQGSLLAGKFGATLPNPWLLLAPGLAATALLVAYHGVASVSAVPDPAAKFAGSCDLEALDRYDWPQGSRIMAPPRIGITLLARGSDAPVVAIPFHTASAGVERAYRFLDPSTANPRNYLDQSLATHVAICAWRDEPSAYLEKRYGFAARLMEGKAPAWLAECPTSATSPIRIFRYSGAGDTAHGCPTP